MHCFQEVVAQIYRFVACAVSGRRFPAASQAEGSTMSPSKLTGWTKSSDVGNMLSPSISGRGPANAAQQLQAMAICGVMR